MSLLQQSNTELDDAARGEELTRGTSPIVVASIVAAIVVSLLIGWYTFATKEVPPASGQIIRAAVHFVHHETSGLDASGKPMPREEFNQILIFTHIQLRNQGKNPLFVRQVMTNIVLNDGIHTAYAAVPNDYERFFQATPELAPLHGTPLPLEATIPPGETVEGDFVSAFRLARSDWEARKSLNYSVSMKFQPDLVLQAPASITVQ